MRKQTQAVIPKLSTINSLALPTFCLILDEADFVSLQNRNKATQDEKTKERDEKTTVPVSSRGGVRTDIGLSYVRTY